MPRGKRTGSSRRRASGRRPRREPVPLPAATPGDGVRVRAYRPQDFRSVVRIWRASGIGTGPSDKFAELERQRRTDPDLFLVAERKGRPVGVVLGRFDGRRGWVNHLAVDPTGRRLGTGSALMAELEQRLARKGCPKVNLHVLPENVEVCGFYERLGYGRRALLFMDKWLTAPSGAVGASSVPARRGRGRSARLHGGRRGARRGGP